MLSYRHGYHAGNPADVFKHLVLIQLINALQRKEKGFCYLDTHAGGGVYSLNSGFALKNREHEMGIVQLLKANKTVTDKHSPGITALGEYAELVRAFNSDEALRVYPGSPAIARRLLRPQDRMVLCELHPREYETLQNQFRNDKQVSVHKRDAYEALIALLPPRERRALILIDPAYEVKSEPKILLQALLTAIKKFPTGVYAIWYPEFGNHKPLNILLNNPNIKQQEILHLQYRFPASAILGDMDACGMLIINPPWHARATLNHISSTLQEAYSENEP